MIEAVAVPCGPKGRIAILNRFEYEYEYRVAEYEYGKTHEQSIEPKCSIEGYDLRLFLLAQGQCGRSDNASDFVVLVLSEAVLSKTVLVLVLDGCSNRSDADG